MARQTSIRFDERLLADAQGKARGQGRSLTAYLTELMRADLYGQEGSEQWATVEQVSKLEQRMADMQSSFDELERMVDRHEELAERQAY